MMIESSMEGSTIKPNPDIELRLNTEAGEALCQQYESIFGSRIIADLDQTGESRSIRISRILDEKEKPKKVPTFEVPIITIQAKKSPIGDK